MTDPNEKEQAGQELIETLATLSGLPREVIQSELCRILEDSGHDLESVTLDGLRGALVQYLETIQQGLQLEEASSDVSGAH
jgi:hypothetical protein